MAHEDDGHCGNCAHWDEHSAHTHIALCQLLQGLVALGCGMHAARVAMRLPAGAWSSYSRATTNRGDVCALWSAGDGTD